jgi:hypothetical protein
MAQARRDAIAEFVERLRAELPRPTQPIAKVGNTRWRRLRSIVQEIGDRRISRPHLQKLDAALKDKGIYVDRVLADPELTQDDVVRFSLAPFPPEAMLFTHEKYLRGLIKSHIGNYGQLKSLVLKDTEVRLSTGVRVDILCEDRSKAARGTIVFIELKRNEASDRLATQIRKYADAIRQEPQFKGRPVRAIVVSADVDDATRSLLLASGVPVELLKYSIRLERAALS